MRIWLGIGTEEDDGHAHSAECRQRWKVEGGKGVDDVFDIGADSTVPLKYIFVVWSYLGRRSRAELPTPSSHRYPQAHFHLKEGKRGVCHFLKSVLLYLRLDWNKHTQLVWLLIHTFTTRYETNLRGPWPPLSDVIKTGCVPK